MKKLIGSLFAALTVSTLSSNGMMKPKGSAFRA